MLFMLSVHSSRVRDIMTPDQLVATPPVPIAGYHDAFGNWCTRLVAPAGMIEVTADAVIQDSGELDPVAPFAEQLSVADLPDETLMFLLGSRYCETDLLSQTAWNLFENAPTGWGRVQAICDFVHNHIAFGYENARSTRTASEAFSDRTGVCRDYTHLAIALCRCMNIPARYCTGYLGDIGVPPNGPMDFSAWFEAYLDGQWYVFDPRNNVPRIGRILIARGRDAADVPISHTFGFNELKDFQVWTKELS